VVTEKETGQLKRGYAPMRKYDLIDLFSIAVYNLTVFSAGLALGWYMWNAGT
tara:strand:- start:5868 stop:6023 length:156 start_codon:yes stop_codon:yes gene_type:complete